MRRACSRCWSNSDSSYPCNEQPRRPLSRRSTARKGGWNCAEPTQGKGQRAKGQGQVKSERSGLGVAPGPVPEPLPSPLPFQKASRLPSTRERPIGAGDVARALLFVKLPVLVGVHRDTRL